MPSPGCFSVSAMGFQCCAATSRAVTPPDFLQWNPGSRDQEGGVPGCIFLPKLEDVPGSRNKREQEHEHSQSVRMSLSPSSNAMPSPREHTESQDRSACPAQFHLKMHWLSSQVLGSVGKWKLFLLPSTTSQMPQHSDTKTKIARYLQFFQALEIQLNTLAFGFTPFWVLVTMEQRDSVTLCSDHGSVNMSLYPRRQLQICQRKKVSALGPYSELCQGDLAAQVLMDIFKMS